MGALVIPLGSLGLPLSGISKRSEVRINLIRSLAAAATTAFVSWDYRVRSY